MHCPRTPTFPLLTSTDTKTKEYLLKSFFIRGKDSGQTHQDKSWHSAWCCSTIITTYSCSRARTRTSVTRKV